MCVVFKSSSSKGSNRDVSGFVPNVYWNDRTRLLLGLFLSHACAWEDYVSFDKLKTKSAEIMWDSRCDWSAGLNIKPSVLLQSVLCYRLTVR